MIDPETQSLSFVEGAGTVGKKYFGICLGADGGIVCAPFDATSVLLLRPFSEDLTWAHVAHIGGRDFEMFLREVCG